MMSGMPLETCCAFNERWNNKFYYKVASYWLFLLSHTTMHGSMNVKLLCLITNNWMNYMVSGVAEVSSWQPDFNANLYKAFFF